MSDSMVKYVYVILVLMLISVPVMTDIDRKHVKCLVCQRVVQEMFKEIEKVSSSIKYNKKGYSLDDAGEHSIEMRKSEVFLDDVMDRLCDRMNDYARGTHINTGKLEVIPLIIDKGMNPMLQEYKLIQDGDLESLSFYCESILSEYADDMINLFKSGAKDIESELCFGSKICDSGMSFSFNDEL